MLIHKFALRQLLHSGLGNIGFHLNNLQFDTGSSPARFLSFIGIERCLLEQGAWQAIAIDPLTAISGLDLLPKILRLQSGSFGERLRVGAWIELDGAAGLVENLTRATQGLPKVVRGDLQRWIDIFKVLGAFGEAKAISLQVLHGPDAVELRLHFLHGA